MPLEADTLKKIFFLDFLLLISILLPTPHPQYFEENDANTLNYSGGRNLSAEYVIRHKQK